MNDASAGEDSTATAAPQRELSTRRALAFVYVGYAFRYLFLLVLVPFYARVLGAAEYGRLLTAMGLSQIVWMIAEYGLPAAGVRDVASAPDERRRAELYGLHTSARLTLLAPALLAGAAGTCLSPLLRERPLFGVLATLLGVVAASNLGWYFQGKLAFRTSVLLEVLGFALSLPLILWFVRGPGDGAYVLAVLTFSGVVCTLLGHALALRALPLRHVQLRGGFALARETTALFVHRGLGLIVASSTTYLLSLFASPVAVGWYGAAERIAGVGLSLLQPANQVLVGTVSRRLAAAHEPDAGYALMRQSIFALTAFGFVIQLGCVSLSGLAVPLILGPEFQPSVALLLVLSLMFPFTALAQVLSGQVLIPLRFDGTVSRAGVLGAGATLALVVGLGLAFGELGVAWARALGAATGALLLVKVLRDKQLFGKLVGEPALAWSLRPRGNGP
jgi:O-antigen/teichoic acid export membrane protein